MGVITDHGQPNVSDFARYVYNFVHLQEVWHPGCFRCDICHQLLVDMLYFFKDGQYFCGRHYGEKVYPRCSGCDEVNIFVCIINIGSSLRKQITQNCGINVSRK